MPSPGRTDRNPCIDDVLGFDEAQLIDYMKQNLRADGGFDLEPEGWEKLPKDQREQLAERLRIGAQKVNDAVVSRPVDPDQLAARLHRVQESLPQALFSRSRHERTPTVEVDLDAEAKQGETTAYSELIQDGGRPVYPITHLEEVFEGREEYRQVLRPWSNSTSNDWHDVFQKQLYRWKSFRRWQQDSREPDEEQMFSAYLEEQKRQDVEGTVSRPTASQYFQQLRDSYERRQRHYGQDDGDEGFVAYVDEKKQRDFQNGRRWPGMTEDEYMQMLRHQFEKRQALEGLEDGDEGFAAFVQQKKQKDMEAGRRWPGMTEVEYCQMHRQRFDRDRDDHYWREFRWLREDHGRGGFSEYVAEAKRRLARHGYTQAFEFDKDPTQQDKLTTWVEYLNYECSWLDRYARRLTKLQPDYDKGWQKLVNSGVLRRGETAAGFCTMESAIQCQRDRDAAKMAVEYAKQAGMDVLERVMNDPKSKAKFPKPLRIEMMKQATIRVEAAKASLREITSRCDLILEFVRGASKYKATEKNLTLQEFRLQWVKEQIPLIEDDVRVVVEAARNCSRTRRKTKRRLEDDRDDEEADDRSLKRRKPTLQARSISDDPVSTTRAKANNPTRIIERRSGQPHGDARGDRQSSHIQQIYGGINTALTGTSQPTMTRTTTRWAGETGEKVSREPGQRQLRSCPVQPQASLHVRRSPRFATTRDKSGGVSVLPCGVARTRLRSHHKTASVIGPHT